MAFVWFALFHLFMAFCDNVGIVDECGCVLFLWFENGRWLVSGPV